MLICLPAVNIMDKATRVAAHRHTPCSREELKRLQELVPRLRELSISKIVCADLDAQSADAIARRLNVPVEEWESLRRWNWGKLHGSYVAAADAVRDRIAAPDVPVKGGDSRTSFGKRIAASHQRLATAQQNILVIVDEEVLEKLTGAGSAQRYHLYEIALKGEHVESHETAPLRAATPG
jgi:histidine phosphatase superfamily protein (branch 1)